MNFQTIKQQVCRFLMSVMGFLLLPIANGVAEGSLFLPLAILLVLADLLAMNLLCGLAQPRPVRRARAQVRRVRHTAARHPVPLHVVRGGRAA